jgi:hypothetical protein
LNAVVDRFEADPTDVEDASARLRAGETGSPGTDGDARGSEDPESGRDGTDHDSSELADEHIPSPSPSPRGPGTGLSQKVAEALYSDDTGEDVERPDPGRNGRTDRDDASSADRSRSERNDRTGTSSSSRPTGEPSLSKQKRDSDGTTHESTPDDDAGSEEGSGDRIVDDEGGDPAPEVVGPVVDEDDDEARDEGRSQSRLGQLSETVRDLL